MPFHGRQGSHRADHKCVFFKTKCVSDPFASCVVLATKAAEVYAVWQDVNACAWDSTLLTQLPAARIRYAREPGTGMNACCCEYSMTSVERMGGLKPVEPEHDAGVGYYGACQDRIHPTAQVAGVNYRRFPRSE